MHPVKRQLSIGHGQLYTHGDSIGCQALREDMFEFTNGQLMLQSCEFSSVSRMVIPRCSNAQAVVKGRIHFELSLQTSQGLVRIRIRVRCTSPDCRENMMYIRYSL